MDKRSSDKKISVMRSLRNQSQRYPNMVDFNLYSYINSFVDTVSIPTEIKTVSDWMYGWDYFRLRSLYNVAQLYDDLNDIFDAQSRSTPKEIRRVLKKIKDLAPAHIRRERHFIDESTQLDDFGAAWVERHGVAVRGPDGRVYTQVFIFPGSLTDEWKQYLISLKEEWLDLLLKYEDFTISRINELLDFAEEKIPANIYETLTDSDLSMIRYIQRNEDFMFMFAVYTVGKLFDTCIDTAQKVRERLVGEEWRENDWTDII